MSGIRKVGIIAHKVPTKLVHAKAKPRTIETV